MFPTVFPASDISTAIGIITSGQIAARERDLGEAVWNVIGYAGNIALHNANAPAAARVTLTANESNQLEDLKDALARPQLSAHKFGDGSLLKLLLPILLQYLPTLLGLLGGVPKP